MIKIKKKTVNIDKDLHQQIAIIAAKEDRTIGSIVNDAITDYLNEVVSNG